LSFLCYWILVNNGLLVQFGRQNVIGGSTFPIAYTNVNSKVICTQIGVTWYMERISTVGLTSFVTRFDYSGSSYLQFNGLFWISIGY